MSRVKELYKIIQDAQEELDLIRKTCPHNNYKIENYMWAPGHIEQGYICEDCGEYIGEMKTAKEWIENLNWFQGEYEDIKSELLKISFDEKLLSWNQFVKLTNFDTLC